MKRSEVIEKITRSDIKWAMAQINAQNWVPKRRNSTEYSLRYKGRNYPPKYLIVLAGKHATDEVLNPEDHGGGKRDSNRVLLKLGVKGGRIVNQPSRWSER
ncbi:MAG: hypothetical protein ACRD1O_02690 [Terriglobia bacterium]